MGVGRPKGSKNNLTKSWVYDQLIERNFDVLKEAVDLYLSAEGIHQKTEILRILVEYALPKPRPVDASGETEGAPTITFMAITDEQAMKIADAAQKEHEAELKGE